MYPLLLDYLAPYLRRLEHIPLHLAQRFLLAVAGLLLLGMAGAFAVAPLTPDFQPQDQPLQLHEIGLQHLQDQLQQLAQQKNSYIREETVRNGDTLGVLLARLQVQDPETIRALLQHPQARKLLQLKAGRLLQAQVDDQGQLLWLRYQLLADTDTRSDKYPVHDVAENDGTENKAAENNTVNNALLNSRVLLVRRHLDGSLVVQTEFLKNSVQTEIRSGVIRSSLYAATDDADIPDAIANQMAEILSADIDFHRDLRKGDYFRVMYETYVQQGAKTGAGKIIGLEFYANKTLYQAVRFGDQYYTPEGKSLKKTFLRSPMAFTRVTSGFSMRLHPILKTWRAHKGVDYGAPAGTPIHAVADGVIEFMGVKGGYGNVVVLRHGGSYSTLYGHMSRFSKGFRQGSHVTQGAVIGYVGQTGWATGPHLHYEFLVNGEQRNPLTIALPTAQPLVPAQLSALRQTFAGVQEKLALAPPLQP